MSIWYRLYHDNNKDDDDNANYDYNINDNDDDNDIDDNSGCLHVYLISSLLVT